MNLRILKNEKYSKELSILFRYVSLLFLLLIFLSDIFLNLLINIFTEISYHFLSFFVELELVNGELIIGSSYRFLVVKECIAPSAYVLISLIILSIPINLKVIYRIITKSVLLFTLFNLLRILFLMWIYIIYGSETFEKYHLIFYEVLSGIITALIIVYYLKKEKIRKIFPIYTDIKYLISKIK